MARSIGLVVTALFLVLAGCAQNQRPLAGSAAPVAPFAEVYRLGPGDKVRLNVFGETALSGESYTVGTEGDISLPLIGVVRVAGMSLREAEREVTRRYADGYVKDPRVNFDMSEFRPFFILGQVKTPGEYPFVNGLTVNSAVAKAGGFTFRADERRVFIRRAGETSEVEVPIRADTPIYPGDVVRVVERFF